MDFEIKQIKELSEKLYENVGKLYHATYFKEYYESGALNWESKYAEYFFTAFHDPPDYYFTAWDGDKLIAACDGNKYRMILDNEIELIGVSLGLTATLSEYRRQGIQKKLINQMIQIDS